jgi:hypothetical protein
MLVAVRDEDAVGPHGLGCFVVMSRIPEINDFFGVEREVVQVISGPMFFTASVNVSTPAGFNKEVRESMLGQGLAQ